MKHLEHTLETYVYSQLQHVQQPDLLLQHPYETLADAFPCIAASVAS
jgi:hypothetical protein